MRKKQNKGFVLLFTAVLSSVILAIALGVASIALKEIKFGTSGRYANEAFFAADAGVECALFNDRTDKTPFTASGSGTITCLGSTINLSGSSPVWGFVMTGLGAEAKGCAKVTVDKTNLPAVTVSSKGYNIGGADCQTASPMKVERELSVTFNEPKNDIEWVPRTVSTGYDDFVGVAYGNNIYVAVGGQGSLYTSTDGIVWTARSAFTSSYTPYYSVSFLNGKFYVTGSLNYIFSSSDGISWSGIAVGSNGPWKSMTYGGGKYVLVGSGSNKSLYSTDASSWSWSPGNTGTAQHLISVTYGNGKFVAINYVGSDKIFTSSDGVTWAAQTVPESNSWVSISYGNNTFVAVSASTDSSSRVMTSSDGVNWIVGAAANQNQWRAVTFGNGLFVAVATGNSYGDRTMFSEDGIAWTSTPAGDESSTGPWGAAGGRFNAVTYGGGKFVAVSNYYINASMAMTADY